MHIRLISAIVVATCLVVGPAHAGKTTGKKLIEYGCDNPDTAFVREHIAEMEKIPFDGVVIRVTDNPEAPFESHTLGLEVFKGRKFEPSDYAHAIEDLKATRFTTLTDNFIQLYPPYFGTIDWYDPNWSVVAHNAACLAKVAKEGGCKGLMLDPEMCDPNNWPLWWYAGRVKDKKDAPSFTDYAAKVRERGREFIRAVNKEYPDITFLMLYGSSLTYAETFYAWNGDGGLSLFGPFLDGMYEAATPGTRFTDGFEYSYGYRNFESFSAARKLQLSGGRSVSACPKEFDQHARVGFGVWIDYNGNGEGWHTDDFSKNYFTPDGLRASLNYALRESDRYVWIWSEHFRWWPPVSAPKEYIDALRLAKVGPGPGEKHPLKPKITPEEAADFRANNGNNRLFDTLRKGKTEVMDLMAESWRFARDEPDKGRKLGWYRPGFDDSAWRAMPIAKYWEECGEDYDGYAWYRTKFTAPEIEAGKRVYLVAGAISDAAWFWLNGKPAGQRDLAINMWNTAFVLDVTGKLKPGANSLAIRVYNRTSCGGIWKPIKVMVE
ncbi:MAG: beta galactosidase jelly roll domain-containing protein [Armatimonadota bacterium]|nr:beta galactosidase jelly roll domain-containing protein [Armatimonadota bacterium]